MASPSTSPPHALTPANTPVPPRIAPLHEPDKGAVVIQQRAPLGSAHPNPVVPGQTTDPSIPGASLGQKALLAKKFAKANMPITVSPTDAIQSPCTQKLAGAKQRHFNKGKPSSFARLAALTDENAQPK